MKFPKLIITGCVTLALASAVWAGGHGGNPAVEARKAHMNLYQFNLNVLGGMIRGNEDYNAEAATKAANSIVALTTLDQSRYWVPGTDSESVEGSRTTAALWENLPDVFAIAGRVNENAAALAAVAGDGLEPMTAAVQALGGSCNDCHRSYRVRQ